MTQDLFDNDPVADARPLPHALRAVPDESLRPLADRMRPKSIDEVIGQKKLIAPGQPLRVAFETKRPHSMILWGPPGVGKTTLARLMADAFGLPYIAISAVLSGVKEIREAPRLPKETRVQKK